MNVTGRAAMCAASLCALALLSPVAAAAGAPSGVVSAGKPRRVNLRHLSAVRAPVLPKGAFVNRPTVPLSRFKAAQRGRPAVGDVRIESSFNAVIFVARPHIGQCYQGRSVELGQRIGWRFGSRSGRSLSAARKSGRVASLRTGSARPPARAISAASGSITSPLRAISATA